MRKNSLLAALFLVLTLAGCSHHTISNDSPPETQYAEGERLLKKERYLEAVERFRVIRSRYPYSKYAAMASLKIGDAHFAEESWVEAAGAYRSFRELYPRNEKAGYALFRIGESNYNMLPGTIDRDLEPANAAIDAYREYIRGYPNSPEAETAKKRIDELEEKLAQKEDYIGNFYFIRDHYNAAATRYRNLLDQYPGRGLDDKALYRLAFSYEKLGEYTKAEEAIERLRQDFADSSYKKQAEKVWALVEAEKNK